VDARHALKPREDSRATMIPEAQSGPAPHIDHGIQTIRLGSHIRFELSVEQK